VQSGPQQQLRAQIAEEKKRRMELVGQFNMVRNKLRYKQVEHEALAKLLTLNPPGGGKNVGRLKRMKESIEFRIATEASTLNAERELIKRLGTINEELDEALKTYRSRRKSELVAKDIDELKKRFDDLRKQITEEDGKLDALYARLREETGWGASRQPAAKKKHIKQQEPLEISLEDIATIKSKKPNGGEKADGV
jgi:uncharacterized coiled-coil DUF342 family protein